MGVHHIKARKVGEAKWSFVTRSGYLNTLRVHAARFHSKEQAEAVVANLSAEHAGKLEFKAQEA